MMKRTLLILVLFGLFTSPLFAQEKASVAARPVAPAAVQPAYGEKLHLTGIPNAGKISDLLYRGAQPKDAGLAELKKLGITTIVDLRGEDRQKTDWEHREATALGMRFVYIPVSGWSPPTDEQLAQFLSLFRDDPPQKIFVHCRYGSDRTGMFVAAYRMAMDKWSSEQAVKEMYFFGFNGFWHPSMQEFIREFPEHLKSSPPLAALRPQPATP
jgi:tyrosine-protein phosphatase SIW14